jgi:hypothetical protein
MRSGQKILVGKPEGKRPSKKSGRIILKWILKKIGSEDAD